jgi:histidinol-phosphate aminotransferase
VFVGVGSDEAIDALQRCFCAPGHDALLACPPTYGMYSVSAAVNDVRVREVPLTPDAMQLDVQGVRRALTGQDGRGGSADGDGDSDGDGDGPRDETKGAHIKLVLLCSPGNPTGAVLRRADVQAVLATEGWNGVVVVDEAYIDFAPRGASLAPLVARYPNLVVLQTLSKSFGLAGIRVGVAFADPAVARLLNSLKAPYNVSNPASQLAMAALEERNLAVMRRNVERILKQRDRLIAELPKIKGVGRFKGGFDANFVLVEMEDWMGRPSNDVALEVYKRLAGERGVVVRFRGSEKWCEGCLRITVGTEQEVDRFLQELTDILFDIHKRTREEAARRDAERGVVG